MDYVGFSLLALAFGSLEVVLDKGQQDDWFGSHFIVTFMVLFAVCLVAVIFWELHLAKTKERPILDLYLLKNRTFCVSMLLMFVLGSALYGINTLLPQLLQNLMGYSAEQAGLTLSTGGLATLLAMPIVGIAVGKMDPRKLIALGFIATAGGLIYMTGLDLQMSMSYAAKLRFFQCAGLGLLFVPISTMSYVGTPAFQEQRRCWHDQPCPERWGLLRYGSVHDNASAASANPPGCTGQACCPEQHLFQESTGHAHPDAWNSCSHGADLSPGAAASQPAFLPGHHLVLRCGVRLHDPHRFLHEKSP